MSFNAYKYKCIIIFGQIHYNKYQREIKDINVGIKILNRHIQMASLTRENYIKVVGKFVMAD